MATESTAAEKPAVKTATRKKTTRRGPTKATALKALGLTKEDLDLLKEVKTARETAAAERERSSELQTLTTPPGEYTSYNDEPAAGSPAPPDLAAEVAAEVPQAGPFFIRNLRNVENNFRLERQQKQGAKRFELKPRGQRGDLKPLQPGDLNDEVLLTNINLGMIEIITAAEAKSILEKQAINQQATGNPLHELLRNPTGESYKPENIRTEAEFNSQGITVAQLDPRAIQGGLSDKQLRNQEDIQRVQPGQPAPQNIGTLGGNPHIISDGFARPDAAAQADAVARRKDLEGPAAGLGGVTVTVDPVQRT